MMMKIDNNSTSDANRTYFMNKKALRLVLDEPVLFVEDKPAMVRGEVIVHFSHDTTIQGPIELVFEAIQTFFPWSEIMVNRALGGPIESKLQVIELSLLPPNNRGIMPAGVQRFPFEFPIPPTLPPTLNITNRLAIYYRLTATLRKSNEGSSLVDWARRSMSKKKLTDISYLRLVRAIEATPARVMTPPLSASSSSASGASTRGNNNINNSMDVAPYNTLWSQYNNRLSLDEQHDRLMHSLGGRTTDNFSRSLNALTKEHGVRYKLSVDRTAIALGTSVGLEVVLQPTQVRTKVRSIYLSIDEKRTYKMKIPGHHSLSNAPAETRKNVESSKMLLKWAYGYPIPPEDDDLGLDLDFGYSSTSLSSSSSSSCDDDSKDAKKNFTRLGQQYSHNIKHCKTLRQLDQPFLRRPCERSPSQQQQHNQHSSSTLLGKNDTATASISALSAMKPSTTPVPELLDDDGLSSTSTSTGTKDHLLNLKFLDYPINLGEYFEGRFVLPVPPCNGILHASMDHDSISIQHWLRMVVVLEQEGGRMFEIALESPMHMLDCRLVADDERQTLLPPPPSYNADDNDRSIQSTVFWEQRQPITTMAQWGTCNRPCPCQIKQQYKSRGKSAEHSEKGKRLSDSMNSNSSNSNNNNNNSSSSSSSNNDRSTASNAYQLLQLQRIPAWGAPPLYGE
ncbi:hypothetical protein BCR42DRAFT_481642 [Absidia repens]|uniref:Arrestin C-terminal-like domain-containing protein n=1 Tax=Absidia repens TaxID=90262 RepID=A0A1X2INI3_9FUNG|nr:hypothetical protein BCR42DRAFT_481642 [Absidia repens]